MTTYSPLHVLLVEDNPADTRLVEEAFDEAARPLHLSVTPDGVEALAFLHREGRYAAAPRPDLILLDLNLPRKDGRAVLADVKADPELRRIPVVVLTTSSTPEDIAQAYDLHANCFLTKAADVEQFFALLHDTLHFWLDLAARPAPSAETFPPSAAPDVHAGASSRTVLVVEDDQGIIDFLTLALQDEGYTVLAALGAEALRLARERQPALILCDMAMPEMDGAEVCRRLHADPATANIPVILISAHAHLRDRGSTLPVVDRLAKPVALERLYAAVARWAPLPGPRGEHP